jgi:hypothetical protein
MPAPIRVVRSSFGLGLGERDRPFRVTRHTNPVQQHGLPFDDVLRPNAADRTAVLTGVGDGEREARVSHPQTPAQLFVFGSEPRFVRPMAAVTVVWRTHVSSLQHTDSRPHSHGIGRTRLLDAPLRTVRSKNHGNRVIAPANNCTCLTSQAIRQLFWISFGHEGRFDAEISRVHGRGGRPRLPTG